MLLWTLLLKDLARVRRNPWPYAINLALPIFMTAVIGLAFGSSAKPGGLGRIKLAVVDEDDSIVSSLLRGALNQGDAKNYLEARFLDRRAALEEINHNRISAVISIPRGFTRRYLQGEPAAIELIKNPAQGLYPAIIEEMVQVAVTALNVVARNLGPDFPDWLKPSATEAAPDLDELLNFLNGIGEKLKKGKSYLVPPLITYSRETRKTEKGPAPSFNIFAFLLPGLAAMFFLFLADNAVRDLYREIRLKTFDRYRTVRGDLLAFIFSKVLLSLAILGMASLVVFLGGGKIFSIRWSRPLPLAIVVLTYALFASGFMAFLAALARNERRADVLNGVIILCFSFVGGSFFPSSQLPRFLRQFITPVLPNFQFIETFRSLQFGWDLPVPWPVAAGQLALAGFGLIAAAVWMFRQTSEKGTRF